MISGSHQADDGFRWMEPESIICLMSFRSMAYFRQILDEISEEFPNVKTARVYVDAAALSLVPPHQMIIEVALWVWAKWLVWKIHRSKLRCEWP
jgi:hypothetical protein